MVIRRPLRSGPFSLHRLFRAASIRRSRRGQVLASTCLTPAAWPKPGGLDHHLTPNNHIFIPPMLFASPDPPEVIDLTVTVVTTLAPLANVKVIGKLCPTARAWCIPVSMM
jgi:hypothetical protein